MSFQKVLLSRQKVCPASLKFTRRWQTFFRRSKTFTRDSIKAFAVAPKVLFEHEHD